MEKRTSLACLGAVLLLLFGCGGGAPSASLPADYPWEAVELVAPAGVGSGYDLTTRMVAQCMQETGLAGVPLPVTNKPGGGGSVALAYLDERAGSDNVLAIYSPPICMIHLNSSTELNYVDNTTPVAKLITDYGCFAVKADSPYQTITQVMDALRENPAAIRVGGRPRVLLTCFCLPSTPTAGCSPAWAFTLWENPNQALLLENRREGAARFAAGLAQSPAGKPVGAIVANCNPFTRGHLYLAEQAARQCGTVYFFLLSEDRSLFPTQVRLRLAREGLAHLSNLHVCPTGDYLVSAATFPDYFIKDSARVAAAAGELDLDVFCRYFVPTLGITVRLVGQEPFCPVTRAYNDSMKRLLPPRGVEVRELPRSTAGDGAISASRVRALWREGRLEQLAELVPPVTLNFLLSHQGQELLG